MRTLEARLKKHCSISAEEFPRIAVNALKTLSYRHDMHDKHDNKIIYIDPAEETYAADSWSCLYQAILTWDEREDGIELTIRVREKNYGSDHLDKCCERARAIWSEICHTIERSKQIRPKIALYKAKFAKADELESQGYILQDGAEQCASPSELANSFVMGLLEGKTLRLPNRLTQRHVLVCGPTGSGKSLSIFVPNLVQRLGTSAIITEAVSGNTLPVLYRSTAGWRSKAGHKIIYFNPADLTSYRINPIDQVRTFDDAQHLAHLVINNTTKESHVGDQVWSQSETHLLQALILHVAGFRRSLYKPSEPGDNANFGYIRRLLRKGPGGMEDELRNSRLPLARKEYLAYLNNSSPNFRYGVVSGLMMRLSLFVNPKIAALTEVTDFSMADLRKQLFSVYLATPIHRSDYTPLAAMMFNFFLTFILREVEQMCHPLTIFADEFTNFGYLPDMPKYMTVIRNAGIGICLGIQDPVQLERIYKEKDARILFGQPRTKIFFSPADDQVALRLTKMLGTTTVTESVTASGQLSNREAPKPLLDVFELMQLERNNAYISLGATETIKLEPIKSWDEHKTAIECPVPVRDKLSIDDDLERECLEAEEPPTWFYKGAGVPSKPPALKDIEQQTTLPNGAECDEESYWDTISSKFSSQ